MAGRLTLAVDVGNTRIKFGLFERAQSNNVRAELPKCLAALAIPVGAEPDWTKFAERFGEWRNDSACVVIAGVNPAGIARVISGWPGEFWTAPVVVRHAAELPLAVNVEFPDKVGIDRLLDAVAANVLRRVDSPAVVVDAGTATTVNYVSADGAFEGGAILPGLELGARALHQHTALLPEIDVQALVIDEVDPMGRDTRAAIASGLWFGQVGAIREIVARLAASAGQTPQVFVTGGNSSGLAAALGNGARSEPDLALRALAYVAQMK